jgi:hypothetical protein
MERSKKIKLGILGAVILLLLIGALNAPSIVTVTSKPGATISIATEKGGQFKKIGQTKATYISFGKPKDIYVLAQLGDQVTYGSATQKRFTRQSLSLSLADGIKAEKITDGAVFDAIFQGTKGQGLVAGQNTLINFSTVSANEPVNPQFVGLPFISKIIWYDFNNFVYLTDEGVGQFINGTDAGLSGVGTRITGEVRLDPSNTNASDSPIIKDMAKADDGPLVLLSNTNIFTSIDRGTSLRAISSFESDKRDTSIFASGNSIFKITAPPLTESESDSDIASNKLPMTVQELSYTGKVISTTDLKDSQEVIDIVKKGSTTYVLSYSGLQIIKDGEVSKQSLYFSDVAGMTLYKDKVVLLADSGLWNVSEDGKSYSRLFNFETNGVGLEKSLSIDPNKQLIFGTRPASNKADNSATFVTSF